MTDQDTTMTLNDLAFRLGQDGQSKAPNRPGRIYEQVEWVWICVNKIIDTCLSIPLMLSTAEDQIIEEGTVVQMLRHNPLQTLREFITRTVGFLALYKTAYWIYVEKSGIAPTQMLAVGPDQCFPVIRRGVVVGYELRMPDGSRVPLLLEDVKPLLGFNPYSTATGIGPAASGKLAISSSYQATLFNESSLANGGRLGVVLTTPAGVKLDDAEKNYMISQFNARHGGAANAGKAFLASGGIEVKSFSQTMADLQMIDLRKFDASVICAMFGVPGELVNLNSEAQYAHGPAAQRYITDTITPMLAFIADALNDGPIALHRNRTLSNKCVPFNAARHAAGPLLLKQRPSFRAAKQKSSMDNRSVFAWFAVEDHPAIQEMLRDRAEKLLKYTEKGITLEQVVAAGDLPFDTSELPWAKEWWISAGLMPARWILDGGPDAVLGTQLPEGDTGDEEQETPPDKSLTADPDPTPGDREKASRIWQKYIASWLPLEKEFASAVRSYFRRQRAELLKQLDAAAKDTDDILARIAFDVRAENQKLRAIHRTFYTRAVKLGAAQIAADVAGQSGDALKKAVDDVVRRQAVRHTLATSAANIENVNKTTSARIARTLRQGLDTGEGLPDLRKRIQQEASFSMPRAQRIARTHTGSAVSAGRHESAKYFGADKKYWLTSKDSAVRKSHRQAERDHADGIPLDQAFKVGGDYLLYPGDPGGSPANVVNCRCMELVKTVGKKTFTLNDYDRAPMLDYSTFKSLLNEAQNV